MTRIVKISETTCLAHKAPGRDSYPSFMICIVIGIIGSMALQLLIDFRNFKNGHREIVHAQYEETLEAHDVFWQRVGYLDVIPESARNTGDETNLYSRTAQAYILELKEMGRLLPKIDEGIADHIDAITNLRQYYTVDGWPEANGSSREMEVIGFRTDLAHYILTRDAVLEEIADEFGNGWRNVNNWLSLLQNPPELVILSR